jgi:hypothetical protein
MTKTKLPRKTRIAVWWIRILSIVMFISCAAFVLFCFTGPDFFYGAFWALVFLPVWILFLLPSILLPQKRHWCWTTSIILLCLEIIIILAVCIFGAIHYRYSYYLELIPIVIFYLVPFALLILDRKNYIEMVRQRELEKKTDESGKSPGKDA